MGTYAKVENGLVTHVIVAEQDVIDAGLFGTGWIQTSYNTRGGVHINGGTPLRKNYAGIGMTYDSQRDAFISQKPYNSWILNEQTCNWDAPVARPNDEWLYTWNEETQSWTLQTI